MRRLVQVVLYAVFAAIMGYFSVSPGYQYADPGHAAIKLSLSHAAERVEECAKPTIDEINERALAGKPLSQCARERLPLTIELEIDGEVVHHSQAQPSGLWNDGPAAVYERFVIEAGTHTITARLRDTRREDGWDYTRTEKVQLTPQRYFTITFRAETGGFRFR